MKLTKSGSAMIVTRQKRPSGPLLWRNSIFHFYKWFIGSYDGDENVRRYNQASDNNSQRDEVETQTMPERLPKGQHDSLYFSLPRMTLKSTSTSVRLRCADMSRESCQFSIISSRAGESLHEELVLELNFHRQRSDFSASATRRL